MILSMSFYFNKFVSVDKFVSAVYLLTIYTNENILEMIYEQVFLLSVYIERYGRWFIADISAAFYEIHFHMRNILFT